MNERNLTMWDILWAILICIPTVIVGDFISVYSQFALGL